MMGMGQLGRLGKLGGLSARAGAGSAPTTLEQFQALFSSPVNSGYWDLRAATNSGTYTAANSLATGPNLTQATGGNQPGIDPSLGATFADATDYANFAWAGAAPALCTVILSFVRSAGDDVKRIISDGAAERALFYNSAQLAALAGTVTVDAASVGSRQALFNALTADTRKLIMVTSLNTSLWVGFAIGAPGSSPVGSIRGCVLIDESEPSDLAEARTLGQLLV